MILCASPHKQYQALKGEIDAAVQRVLDSGYYILGPEVKAFEEEFAAYLGLPHFCGVGNGTDALHVALAALGLKAGDEVITTSHTAVATVTAVVQAGCTPVLAEIEPEYYTLDPCSVEACITPRTKAIIGVHIYGQPVDIPAFAALAKKRGLFFIEDCAQAHGAKLGGRMVGTFGDISCFSFYPTKNLGALGDGGGVGTKDPALAEKIRLIRQYGWAERYVSHVHGWNTRLDELQAAVLRVKLRHLDRENARRREIAKAYQAGLRGIGQLTLPAIRENSEHVFHLFAVRSPKRDLLQKKLHDSGVQTLVHYPVPVHLQPAYRWVRAGGGLAVTEALAREELSLPMHPYLTDEEVKRTVEATVRAST